MDSLSNSFICKSCFGGSVCIDYISSIHNDRSTHDLTAPVQIEIKIRFVFFTMAMQSDPLKTISRSFVNSASGNSHTWGSCANNLCPVHFKIPNELFGRSISNIIGVLDVGHA